MWNNLFFVENLEKLNIEVVIGVVGVSVFILVIVVIFFYFLR